MKPKVTILNIIPKIPNPDVEKAVQPLQPEEDMDNSGPVSPTPSNMTENGNFVTQERGKEHVLSASETYSYSYS